jgi:Flp pilus assembly protein TadG
MTVSRLTRLRREDGQAMTELALVLPLFVVLLLAIVQFGIVFNNYLTLTDATRAGARKAAVSRFIGDNGASAVQAVQTAASGLDQATLTPGISVTSTDAGGAPDWTTPGDTVTVTAKYPYTINILGFSVQSGSLTSTTKERLE